MPDNRFYLNQTFECNETVFLEGEEFHHLFHVMRVKPGESVELVNGNGVLAKANLLSVQKQKAYLHIESISSEDPPNYRLILAQALPRMPRLEYILEKTVELGVTELWLFPGELSEKKELSPSQHQRIDHVIHSAVKQSGRLFTPTVLFLPGINFWDPANLPPSCFFGDTKENAPFFLKKLSSSPTKSILVAIGPEKGFHAKEEIWMEKHSFNGIKLHQNILRTDTAAISAISTAFSSLNYF